MLFRLTLKEWSQILKSKHLCKWWDNKKLYEKYSQKKTGQEIIGLPSTSPANAAYSLERLLECWQEVKKGL